MRSFIGVWLALVVLGARAKPQCELRFVQSLDSSGSSAVELGTSAAVFADWSFAGSPLDDTVADNAGAVFAAHLDGGPMLKLLASDGGAGDQFGGAVAAASGRLVVGANGDDDAAQNAGAAYVFEEQGGSFVFVEKLLPSAALAGERFGSSVALHGDRLVVGSKWDPANGAMAGSVSVYRHDGAGFVLEQELLRPDAADHDEFGKSVGVWGDRLVVGAPGAKLNGEVRGTAHVFAFNGVSWVHERRFNGTIESRFGAAVDLTKNVVIVGAPIASTAAVFRFDGSTWTSLGELALIFPLFGSSVATNGSWVAVGGPNEGGGGRVVFADVERPLEMAFALTVDNPGAADSGLGWSLDMTADDVVAGAPFDFSGGGSGAAHRWRLFCERCDERLADQELRIAETFDQFGDDIAAQSDVLVATADLGGELGVFRRVAGEWIFEQGIPEPTDSSQRDFGWDLAVETGRIFASSPDADGASTSSGAIYVYEEQAGSWVNTDKLFAEGGHHSDNFGWSIDAEGEFLAASSWSDFVSVFRDGGSGWTESRIDGPRGGELYGYDVDIDEGRLVIGAPAANRVYFRRWNGSQWVRDGNLSADLVDGPVFWGSMVALDGDWLAIRDSQGVDRIFLYEWENGAWLKRSILSPPFNEAFGFDLALEGDFLLAGDPYRARDTGRALLYRRSGSDWTLQEEFQDSIVHENSYFGWSVALNEGEAFVGAPRHDVRGVVATFPVLPPLALEANPRWTVPGDSVRFHVCRGQPGSLVFLVATEVQGSPSFLKIATGVIGDEGTWAIRATVPPNVSGLVAEFRGLAFDAEGRLSLSREVEVFFD